jgi:Copper resistance protein D
LAFVAALLCLAAFNKLRLTPRLQAGDTRALQALRISIRLELLLGVVILLTTAALTTVTGPPALDGHRPDAAAVRGIQCPFVSIISKRGVTCESCKYWASF